MHFSLQFLYWELKRRKMTKKTNLKTLMAGTTTLLMGLNVFVSPVQAAAQGRSGTALTGASAGGTENGTGQQNGQKDGDQSKASSQPQPQVASSGDNNTDTKSVTENSGIYEDNTKVKDENGSETTISKVAKEQDKHNALGIAGMFGVFSKHTTVGVDFNSNVATREYNNTGDHRSGTEGNNPNLTNKDISYMDKIGIISANELSAGGTLIIGNENSTALTDHGNKVAINGKDLNHLKIENIRKESAVDKKYIDFEEEFNKLTKKSNDYFDAKASEGVKVKYDIYNDGKANFSIDVTNAVPDENNFVYINLDSKYITADLASTLSGLKDTKDAPTIIINVGKDENITNLTSKIQTQLKYGNDQISANGSHSHTNRVLWNFGSKLQSLNISSGYFIGSILAPNATVTASVNEDGNIVADTVNISGGEFHHWDLHSSFPHPFDGGIKVPDKDKGNGHQDNENPKGDKGGGHQDNENPKGDKDDGHQDNENPKGDEGNKEQPNFLKPQPKTPDQPQTPNFSEPKSKTPFPDSETVTPSKPKNDVKSFFKAQAKKHVVTKNVAKKTAVDKKKPVTQATKIDVEHNKITTAKTVTTAVPKKTSVETVSVKKATPKATLPQTGEKQKHTALIGLALSAAALIVGLFGKTKKD